VIVGDSDIDAEDGLGIGGRGANIDGLVAYGACPVVVIAFRELEPDGWFGEGSLVILGERL